MISLLLLHLLRVGWMTCRTFLTNVMKASSNALLYPCALKRLILILAICRSNCWWHPSNLSPFQYLCLLCLLSFRTERSLRWDFEESTQIPVNAQTVSKCCWLWKANVKITIHLSFRGSHRVLLNQGAPIRKGSESRPSFLRLRVIVSQETM